MADQQVLTEYRRQQDRISAQLARAALLGFAGRPLEDSAPRDLARIILPGVLSARELSWRAALDFAALLAPGRLPAIPIPLYTARYLINGLAQVLREPAPTPQKLAARTVRHAEQAGRNTILDVAQRDRRCKGWARVSHGTDCAFCLLLVSRGPVYGAKGFNAHDHDRCTAVPIYEDDWPGRDTYDEVNELYASSTRGEKDKLNAFRRAVHERNADTINAQRRARYAERSPTEGPSS